MSCWLIGLGERHDVFVLAGPAARSGFLRVELDDPVRASCALTRRMAMMVARAAVWEPMPTVDRDWVLDSATEVAGVRT